MRTSFHGFIKADAKLGHGADKNLLVHWLDDDRPIGALAYSWLHRKLRFHDIKGEGAEYLAQVPGFTDLDAVTDEFMALLETLPLRYVHTFKLPFGLLNDTGLFGEIAIGENARFVRANRELQENYPLTLGNADLDMTWQGYGNLLGLQDKLVWEGDYVQIYEEGYASFLADTNPSKRAIEKFKAIVGFALADVLLTPMRSYRPTMTMSHFYVHEQLGDETWNPISKGAIAGPTSRLLEDLSVRVDDPKTFERRCRSFALNMSVVFHDDQKNRRLITAAQWYFDAIAGQSDAPLLAFVQMMVVLEIIYGDEAKSDKIGLGELLRNRCSYAIGRSTSERAEISDRFNEIYSVRSKIVHTGQNRLSENEHVLFDVLSGYCRRAIHHELKLLAQDDKGRRKLLAMAGVQRNAFMPLIDDSDD